jgi:TolB-like protein
MTCAENSPEPIPEWLCRECIEKIAASVTFGRAEQLRLLLTWLGERYFARRSAPSEKEIAMAVLKRNDFDPQTDSLVRKEMSRLREKLARYYLSEGSRDEIVISLRGYLPGFQRRGNAVARSGRACWLVLPFRSNAGMAEHNEQLLEELLIALGEGNGPELVASTTALAYRGRVGDVRQFASECRADYVIEGTLRQRNESIEATVWLVDGQSGRALRSRRITGTDAFELARLAAAWLMKEEAGLGWMRLSY